MADSRRTYLYNDPHRIPGRLEQEAGDHKEISGDSFSQLTVSVPAHTPDQVELFQGVARRVSGMLQRPVVSYANGREIVIAFGQQESLH